MKKLPHMTRIQELVFAACYAAKVGPHRAYPSVDNADAEAALEAALWDVECFKQAVRERKP